jgi:hypothetical protein
MVLGAALPLFFTAGCGSDSESGGDDDDDVVATYQASGTVVDFETGAAIAGQATLSTSNLTPPPTISVSGAEFTIDGIPPHSVFQVLAGSPPDHRNTYGASIEVLEDSVSGIELATVSEQYLGALSSAFGRSSTAGGVLIARAVDEGGAGRSGVPAAAFEINNAAPLAGPYFLDAELQPAPGLTETSSSGYVVFFELAPGLVTINASVDSGYNMEMSSAPTAVATVTLAQVIVRDGPAERPTNVSFAADIRPIFEMRGCASCHSGNGIGKDLGDLQLDGGDEKIFREITQELSPHYAVSRVDLQTPEQSLLLTMPSAEDPPDTHPNVTFASASDWDYLMILVWIEEGALLN